MKNLNTSWNNLKNYLYNNYSKEAGKMIVHTGVVTWILASVAHVGAVIFNKKIDPEQKKFLIPQEIADGIINIIAFYTITNTFKATGARLVATGKWSNKAIRDFVKSHPMKGIKLGNPNTRLGKIYENNEEFYKVYHPFKGGVDMISTSLGSVLSCNLVAPLIRNPIGAWEQKRMLKKESEEKNSLNVHLPLFKANTIYKNNGIKV